MVMMAPPPSVMVVIPAGPRLSGGDPRWDGGENGKRGD
jgi:hypothetical protein